LSSLSRPERLWGPPSLLSTGYLGLKRPGREADHSPPSSAEVKNAWGYTSTPQYVFMAWCLVKHRDNFAFVIFYIMFQYPALQTNMRGNRNAKPDLSPSRTLAQISPPPNLYTFHTAPSRGKKVQNSESQNLNPYSCKIDFSWMSCFKKLKKGLQILSPEAFFVMT
jgi:hypothetical protein